MIEEKKFYFAVNDQTYFKAKMINGKIEFVEDEDFTKNKYGFNNRVITERFVNDPKLAVINAIIPNHRESNDPEKREYIKNNIKYNKEEKCWIFDEYLTLGTEQWPKACQMEKFLAGEYTFNVIRHEIQVLTSEIADFTDFK